MARQVKALMHVLNEEEKPAYFISTLAVEEMHPAATTELLVKMSWTSAPCCVHVYMNPAAVSQQDLSIWTDSLPLPEV